MKMTGWPAVTILLLLLFPFFWRDGNVSYAQANLSNTIYMWDVRANIYTIDSSTGQAVLVGQTRDDIVGMAFYGSSLYGVTRGTLYSIDPDTLTATQIGPNGDLDSIGAFAAAPDGTLWGVSEDGNVYTIDRVTGTPKLIGYIGSPYYAVNAVAFSPDGSTLYASITVGPGTEDFLATIDLQNGSATLYPNPIGDSETFINVYGLTFQNGVLYGADEGYFFSINLSTGKGTEIASLSINVMGMTTSPSSGGLWQGAASTGNGWLALSWFGAFNTAPYPWIYHQTLGWLYPVGSSTVNIWFYDPQWDGVGGWWWTSSSVFPWVFSMTENEWLYYDAAASAPQALQRWFANASGQWATH